VLSHIFATSFFFEYFYFIQKNSEKEIRGKAYPAPVDPPPPITISQPVSGPLRAVNTDPTEVARQLTLFDHVRFSF